MSHRILADLLDAFTPQGPGAVPLTATASGAEMPDNRLAMLVTPTWVSASNKLILPPPVAGKVVIIAGASTGGVLQSTNTATISINGATSLTVAPNETVIVICDSPTKWKAFAIASDGTTGALDDSSSAKVFRGRFTAAQVNAGADILPALPGKRYRVHDMALTAIGGNAATATSVDIRGTQSASSVNLLAAAVAGLTQNTLLRAGATNAAILAGGVSFVANDANTAVRIDHTGSDLATATHVDVLMNYTIETA